MPRSPERCRIHQKVPDSRINAGTGSRGITALFVEASALPFKRPCRPCPRLTPARSDAPRPACRVASVHHRSHTGIHLSTGVMAAFCGSAHIMLTSNIQAKPPSAGSNFLSIDFVSTDAADLASHMSHCAGSHSPFFPFQAAFQSAHSALSPRLITVASVATICLSLLAAV